MTDTAHLAETDLREIGTPSGALRYYDCGPGSGEAPVLLFLHGSGPGVTGWRNFRGDVPAFAERFRCLILEFPGFGVSDDFGGHPMFTAQAAVTPFLDALGVDGLTSWATRWAAPSASSSRSTSRAGSRW